MAAAYKQTAGFINIYVSLRRVGGCNHAVIHILIWVVIHHLFTSRDPGLRSENGNVT